MPRVKGGTVARKRRKKILKLAKGYYGSKHLLYRTANEQVMKSLAYAYRDRKRRKRDFRKLWITRINAASRLNGLTYSKLINGLSKAGVEVNRKMLADIAVTDEAGFAAIVEIAKKGLAGEKIEVPAAPKAAPVKKAPVKKVVVKEETPVVEEAPVVEKTPVVKKTPVVEKSVDLSKFTVAELKAMAKEKGLTGYTSLKKADLIKALK